MGGQQQEMAASASVSPNAKPALDVTHLYQEHAAFIGRVLLRLLGDGTHVDDLLQETFIVAFQKRETFDSSRAAASSWLYGIASNLCKHHRRGAGRFSILRGALAKENSEPPLAPDGELEREQEIALVQRLVQKLPFKQREVFVLFEIEELGGKEIADMLEIPIGTVWTRLHDARRRFRESLKHQQLASEVHA